MTLGALGKARTGYLIVALAILATALPFVVGKMALAFVPALAFLALVVITVAPTKFVLTAFLFGALFVDNPRERPHMGLWRTPLYDAGTWIYDTLQKKGFGPIKFFGIEALLYGFILLALFRYLARSPAQRTMPVIPSSPILLACLFSAAAVLFLELWGIARGGNLSRSLLQFRPMLFVNLLPILLAAVIRERKQVQWLLLGIVSAGAIRATVGCMFWLFVLRHRHTSADAAGSGRYATMHSDTILWVTCVMIVLFALLHKPDRWLRWLGPALLLLFFAAIFINNRRLAYVGMAMAVGLYYLIAPLSTRRRVHRYVGAVAPFVLLYLAAGWNAGGKWAAPVKMVKGIITSEDSSSISRDIENFNLIYTASRHPVLGSGFGHEYIEKVSAVDLSNIFEAFRYLPHNNTLWLLGAGGAIGYSAFTLFLTVGLYFASRMYMRAIDRTSQLVGLGFISCAAVYSMQAYGDMGLQSWSGSVLLGTLLGMVAILHRLNSRAATVENRQMGTHQRGPVVGGEHNAVA